jgi:ornithine cyclodeaminase/alanine dehydrogenase-like protein (mu-crystallin family)
MKVIDVDTVRRIVSFEHLIEPVADAFTASSAGRAQNDLLVLYPQPSPEAGDVYVKTATVQDEPIFVVKVSPWFKGNVETGVPQGGFLAVFNARTGHTLAILDEQHYLSDIRTAAAGALAARTLAPRHISTVAVLGAGVQAYWQARALYHERKFENLLLWARNPSAADRLSARLRSGFSGISITVCDDIEEVVRRCDVLITATQAREPLVRGEWLHPGQHITAVGADDPAKCELDSVALNRARVFADSVDTVCANGDLHRWIASGAYARERIAGEIGDVLAGTKPGREKSTDITIAKFVGIGAQDLVAARVTLERLGTHVAVANPLRCL